MQGIPGKVLTSGMLRSQPHGEGAQLRSPPPPLCTTTTTTGRGGNNDSNKNN